MKASLGTVVLAVGGLFSLSQVRFHSKQILPILIELLPGCSERRTI